MSVAPIQASFAGRGGIGITLPGRFSGMASGGDAGLGGSAGARGTAGARLGRGTVAGGAAGPTGRRTISRRIAVDARVSDMAVAW